MFRVGDVIYYMYEIIATYIENTDILLIIETAYAHTHTYTHTHTHTLMLTKQQHHVS